MHPNPPRLSELSIAEQALIDFINPATPERIRQALVLFGDRPAGDALFRALVWGAEDQDSRLHHVFSSDSENCALLVASINWTRGLPPLFEDLFSKPDTYSRNYHASIGPLVDPNQTLDPVLRVHHLLSRLIANDEGKIDAATVQALSDQWKHEQLTLLKAGNLYWGDCLHPDPLIHQEVAECFVAHADKISEAHLLEQADRNTNLLQTTYHSIDLASLPLDTAQALMRTQPNWMVDRLRDIALHLDDRGVIREQAVVRALVDQLPSTFDNCTFTLAELGRAVFCLDEERIQRFFLSRRPVDMVSTANKWAVNTLRVLSSKHAGIDPAETSVQLAEFIIEEVIKWHQRHKMPSTSPVIEDMGRMMRLMLNASYTHSTIASLHTWIDTLHKLFDGAPPELQARCFEELIESEFLDDATDRRNLDLMLQLDATGVSYLDTLMAMAKCCENTRAKDRIGRQVERALKWESVSEVQNDNVLDAWAEGPAL